MRSRNKAGSDMAKSMEQREPVAGWMYVAFDLMIRHRLFCNKNLLIAATVFVHLYNI